MPPGISFGRLVRYDQRLYPLNSRYDTLPAQERSVLPFGNGRSYGDVCLNEHGALLLTRGLDRFVSFDADTGVLECEAGILLSEIIDRVLPAGWFPAVTPGTALVTVGGAIANDVHGKNHHRYGSFGHHVLSLRLLRSDGARLVCSREENPEWFSATIGGMGLTGLITEARIQLRRVPGLWVDGDSRRFTNLEEFFALARQSDADYEYTVAWLDCAARGRKLGRGIFMRGNHVAGPAAPLHPGRARRFPLTPPFSAVSNLTVRLFNELYYHRPSAQRCPQRWHYRPFLYPLDGLLDWNRMYGPRGFYQYQCVLPDEHASNALPEMLERIGRSGQGSFLVVLKEFGTMTSLGIMSFPRPGVTLALDFPNRGARTLELLASLDAITRAAGGAVYPAKDARMSAASFQQYFPRWKQFKEFVDPAFSSSLWRRVSGNAA